jgi:hypothetical protein
VQFYFAYRIAPFFHSLCFFHVEFVPCFLVFFHNWRLVITTAEKARKKHQRAGALQPTQKEGTST